MTTATGGTLSEPPRTVELALQELLVRVVVEMRLRQIVEVVVVVVVVVCARSLTAHVTAARRHRSGRKRCQVGRVDSSSGSMPPGQSGARGGASRFMRASQRFGPPCARCSPGTP